MHKLVNLLSLFRAKKCQQTSEMAVQQIVLNFQSVFTEQHAHFKTTNKFVWPLSAFACLPIWLLFSLFRFPFSGLTF